MEKCPKCERIENQIKAGYNKLGSQRCKCKECGIYYTIEAKRMVDVAPEAECYYTLARHRRRATA